MRIEAVRASISTLSSSKKRFMGRRDPIFRSFEQDRSSGRVIGSFLRHPPPCLKSTKRKGRVNHGIKGGSIADHIYWMALMSLIAAAVPALNRERLGLACLDYMVCKYLTREQLSSGLASVITHEGYWPQQHTYFSLQHFLLYLLGSSWKELQMEL